MPHHGACHTVHCMAVLESTPVGHASNAFHMEGRSATLARFIRQNEMAFRNASLLERKEISPAVSLRIENQLVRFCSQLQSPSDCPPKDAKDSEFDHPLYSPREEPLANRLTGQDHLEKHKKRVTTQRESRLTCSGSPAIPELVDRKSVV